MDLKKRLDTLHQYNFRHIVDYDSDYIHNCDDSCEPYCRCGRVTNARVTSVNVDPLVSHLSHGVKDELIKYAIDRIVHHAKIDMGDFTINISPGYYGEEIGDIRLHDHKLYSIRDSLVSILYLDEEKTVKALLEYEYGYLLPQLDKPLNVYIHETEITNIDVVNNDHYRRLDKELVTSYKDWKLPRAVLLDCGVGNYRLIDGYHRIRAAIENKLKKVMVIILSSKE
jgi:hypothetical protein